MRVFHDAPVRRLRLAALDLLDLRRNKPAAHIHHGNRVVVEHPRVVGAGRLQGGVIHDDSVFLLLENALIGRFQEVVFAVNDGVLAIQNAEQLYRTAPCVVMGTVHFVRAAA
ncbi:hypothetical protein D3C77_355270 [compost metagenome]